MPLSQQNQETFLTALNAIVEDSATVAAREVFSADPTANVSYPPNHGFTKLETSALRALNHTSDLQSALRKIFADVAGSAIFGALSLIDGVGDPDTKCGPWTGVVLDDQPDDNDEYREMLHDAFYDDTGHGEKSGRKRNGSWILIPENEKRAQTTHNSQ